MEQAEKALSLFEERLSELKRKGDVEKVSFLEKLHKKIMPSQLERIQANDKTVLRELFIPKWVDWELLQAWANRFRAEKPGLFCVFCSQPNELGINFFEKFVCETCFFKIKKL